MNTALLLLLMRVGTGEEAPDVGLGVVEAIQLYSAGAEAARTYSAGASSVQCYSAGAEAAQIGE